MNDFVVSGWFLVVRGYLRVNLFHYDNFSDRHIKRSIIFKYPKWVLWIQLILRR